MLRRNELIPAEVEIVIVPTEIRCASQQSARRDERVNAGKMDCPLTPEVRIAKGRRPHA